MGFAIEVVVVSQIALRLLRQLEGKNFTASGHHHRYSRKNHHNHHKRQIKSDYRKECACIDFYKLLVQINLFELPKLFIRYI